MLGDKARQWADGWDSSCLERDKKSEYLDRALHNEPQCLSYRSHIFAERP